MGITYYHAVLQKRLYQSLCHPRRQNVLSPLPGSHLFQILFRFDIFMKLSLEGFFFSFASPSIAFLTLETQSFLISRRNTNTICLLTFDQIHVQHQAPEHASSASACVLTCEYSDFSQPIYQLLQAHKPRLPLTLHCSLGCRFFTNKL